MNPQREIQMLRHVIKQQKNRFAVLDGAAKAWFEDFKQMLKRIEAGNRDEDYTDEDMALYEALKLFYEGEGCL
jgi:hypothetical protein